MKRSKSRNPAGYKIGRKREGERMQFAKKKGHIRHRLLAGLFCISQIGKLVRIHETYAGDSHVRLHTLATDKAVKVH